MLLSYIFQPKYSANVVLSQNLQERNDAGATEPESYGNHGQMWKKCRKIMAGDSRPIHNTPEKLPAAQQRQSQSAVVYQRPAAVGLDIPCGFVLCPWPCFMGKWWSVRIGSAVVFQTNPISSLTLARNCLMSPERLTVCLQKHSVLRWCGRINVLMQRFFSYIAWESKSNSPWCTVLSMASTSCQFRQCYFEASSHQSFQHFSSIFPAFFQHFPAWNCLDNRSFRSVEAYFSTSQSPQPLKTRRRDVAWRLHWATDRVPRT